MDFDFSDDAKALREQARKFFDERAGPTVARAAMNGTATFDAALWESVIDLGWTAARVPEAHGGVGMSSEAACVLAEEAGRSLAPIPLAQALAATEALIALGTPEQQARWLPGIADGSVVAVTGWAEGGTASPAKASAVVEGGTVTGTKSPVADLAAATMAIVSAAGPDGPALYIVDLSGEGVSVAPIETLDLVRRHGMLTLAGAAADPLGTTAGYHDWLDRAAILGSFEAMGTATAAMDMAVAYAKERTAFGQKIGRYQGVKHKCADMYIKLELARAHALHAAWAMEAGAAELRQAASAARVASLDALAFAAEENVQIHGGIGFTWESDCQFYYRRNRALVAALGSRNFWADRLVRSLEQRNAAAA
ncbi:MAG: acyl-CoA dehydrogenase family protein [Janthinobacterium lividum]